MDDNGGIPDLDLLAGIGAHRSPLTHSIVAGIVAEGLFLALADLSAEVDGRLPIEHDPLWDELARIGRPLTRSLAIGTSAGLAYHLLVDALVQPAAYHDLPVSMPLEAHQSILAVNGVAEGIDTAARVGTRGSVSITIDEPPEKSIGRRVVDAGGEAVAGVVTIAANGAKALYAAVRPRRAS